MAANVPRQTRNIKLNLRTTLIRFIAVLLLVTGIRTTDIMFVLTIRRREKFLEQTTLGYYRAPLNESIRHPHRIGLAKFR